MQNNQCNDIKKEFKMDAIFYVESLNNALIAIKGELSIINKKLLSAQRQFKVFETNLTELSNELNKPTNKGG